MAVKNSMKFISIIILAMLCGCTSNKDSKTSGEASKDAVSEYKKDDEGCQNTSLELEEGTARVLNSVVDTLALSNAYNALMAHPKDKGRQEDFFKAFPNTWYEFISTYGYSEQNDHNLYHVYDRHIDAFGNLSLINDTVYCSKLIDISIGAYFDADAPNSLKMLLERVVGEKKSLMMELVTSMLESDQMLFWGFYWASLHKEERMQAELDKLVSSYQSKYPEEVEIMRFAFDCFCGKSMFSSGPETRIGLRFDE